MVAIKEDEITLQGIRNYLYILWDIPIEKSKLQSDSYNDPTLHSFHCNPPPINNNIKSICDVKITQLKTERIFQFFYDLNQFIDVNECDYYVIYNKN